MAIDKSKRFFDVSKLEDLPSTETFYVIAHNDSYVSDGGYPGHNSTTPFLKFTVFLDRVEWEDTIRTLLKLQQFKGRAFVMMPIKPEVNVNIDVKLHPL